MVSPLLKRRFNTLTLIGSLSLLLSTAYLFLGIAQHDQAIKYGQKRCHEEKITPLRIAAFPEMGDVHKRRITVEAPDQIRLFYYNTRNGAQTPWVIFKQSDDHYNQSLLKHVTTFKWFSNNWVWREKIGERVIWWDARFFGDQHFLWGIDVSGDQIKWLKMTSLKKAFNYLRENLK